MSMNLEATVKKTGEEVNLWQTPTWVTEMCIYSYKKNKKGEYKKRHWKDTRALYLAWVKSHTQGAFHSSEDVDAMKITVESHQNYIMSLDKIEWSLG